MNDNLKFANCVFVDFEADNVRRNNGPVHFLLQVSAVKIAEDGSISYFNQYCYQEKNLTRRIANLLNKPKNWFKQEEFKTEKEVIEEFDEFAKNTKVYNYGDFDEVLISRLEKRLGIKTNFKLINYELELKERFKISKSLSLQHWSLVLDIKSNDNHDALDDAKTLFELIKKTQDIKNEDEILEKINLIRFYPRPVSSEYVSNPEESEFNWAKTVFIFSQHKSIINDEVDNLRDQYGEFLSNNMLDYLEKELPKEEKWKEIFILELDQNNNVVRKLETRVKHNNENNINFFPEQDSFFINSGNNTLYLTNSLKMINNYAEKENKFYYFVNYSLTPKFKKPKIALEHISEIIAHVREAIKLFKNN